MLLDGYTLDLRNKPELLVRLGVLLEAQDLWPPALAWLDGHLITTTTGELVVLEGGAPVFANP